MTIFFFNKKDYKFFRKRNYFKMEEIDESLYSRQEIMLGKEAMQKMAKSSVFLSGLGGVGLEIGKKKYFV